MQSLSHADITTFFFSLAILLGLARFLGELARRFNQPTVLGELVAGILLGPTVLGTLRPEWVATLFPETGNVQIGLEALTTLSITLFLLVAGMEVDLSMAWRQGRTALTVASLGIIFPFFSGFAFAWAFQDLLVSKEMSSPWVFPLFFATAMSITALPVIAKILMDLNLYRTDLGMIVIAGAILNDLVGWNAFALLIGMLDAKENASPASTLIGTLIFLVVMLTGVRWVLHRILPWILAHASWPGGILGFVLTLSLFSAAIAEWIGIHAIFGAFLFGVAVGDSEHLRQRVRSTIEQFVSFIFAPLFFASIGLKVNFIANFDLLLALAILAIGSLGKVVGCGLAARWCGLAWRESWAVGFGMNARGAMEIILGLFALQKGLIDERMFVALVIMALVTSVTSGTFIQLLLQRKKPVRLTDFLTATCFQPLLVADDRKIAVRELSELAAAAADLPAQEVSDLVWHRETLMSTGLENGLAVPHARVAGIKRPIVAAGIAREGVDFDSFDGNPARLIFLILTPVSDNGAQIEILADISRTFHEPGSIKAVLKAETFTEFLAAIRTRGSD